ncbi:hypothetical protein [Hymenobacter persicinus]|uniref:Uncharacterized protein n=1 Tax=Hymenobacter persicinus TaxID=2025506 RepID=A0A4Q5L7E8_9BACT|nr:hypothetical protein [Hymenobacter persicinus]RYU76090.1 hypothetical protein EWM57_19045 [Hymenobacter persicinus]
MTSFNKKQLAILAILAAVNLLLGPLVVGNGQDLTGRTIEAHSPEMRRAGIITTLFGIQLFSVVLGALFAAIPYKQKPYNEKLLTLSLSIAIAVQGFMLLAGIIKLLF